MRLTQEPVFLKSTIEKFLTYLQARNLSRNTIRAYRADLADLVSISGNDISLDQLDRKLVRKFIVRLNENGIEPSSIRRKLAAVKTFAKWLESEGLLESAELIDSISGPRRREELPDVPSEAEMRSLLDGEISTAASARDRAILELLYGSCIRVEELVGVNVDDFREEDVLLVRGKGKKERYVIVGEYARHAIKSWLPIRAELLKKFQLKTPALFFSVGPRRSAERLDVRSVGRILKAIAEAKGLDPIKYHPHLLRHACASHMHDHGASLQARV